MILIGLKPNIQKAPSGAFFVAVKEIRLNLKFIEKVGIITVRFLVSYQSNK